jgi:RimJ/RimL family protein N-acetyltransferase
MRYDTTQNPLYKQWAAKVIGVKEFGPCATLAFFTDDLELQAVVVYSHVDEKNCEINIASHSPKWCSKLVLKIGFAIPFIQYGLNRMTATIRESNTKSIALVERLGFRRVGELEEFYESGESAILYGLTKTQCRWL